tara:strand:+ start:2117 stop:2674 length:558 start_codon:yes stop_codon:yes gene_type:complete
MEKIENVKLGMNPKDMVVVVNADVTMKNEDDKDDLYITMFNIMEQPLRLGVFTVGDLWGLVRKNTGMNDEQIENIAQTSPEKYLGYALGSPEKLGEVGKENVRIVLDSEGSAKKARLILSSMIEKKYYLQKSKYDIEGKLYEKEQKVDTEELIPQLKMMMEIVKRWENFDAVKFREDIQSGKIKL